MSKIKINSFVDDGLEDMVAVTGLPRSGTSIVGKLVGSFDGFEYAFEPPLLPYLDARLKLGDGDDTVELVKTYLYHDYYSNYLHGRRYNFRSQDHSYILSMKPFPEVVERWSSVQSMDDAVDESLDGSNVFSFKSPAVYGVLGVLLTEFPEMRVVDIARDPDRIVASLMAKRWFWDENLGEDATGMWPFHEHEGVPLVPYLVDEGDKDWWQETNPESRTVYMCNRMLEDRIEFKESNADHSGYYELSFGEFVSNPSEKAQDMAEFLGADFGAKTGSVVGDISPTEAKYDIDNLLNDCDPEVEEEYHSLSQRLSSI